MQLSLISLALTKVYGGAAPAFSPLSLFAASEVGAWYDPSDLTTMFQDAAGTTPVTADGQPVGKILDKSGRGNHATQATAASRPLYKTDGTYHWLQFDGVDDSLSTAAINFTSTDKMSGWFGASFATASPRGRVFGIGANSLGSFSHIVNISMQECSVRGSAGAALYSKAQIASPAAGVSEVISMQGDLSASVAANSMSARLNGGSAIFGDVVPGGGNFGNFPIIMGYDTGNVWYLQGNIYSLIIRGALSTTQEITATETWVNQRTGAY